MTLWHGHHKRFAIPDIEQSKPVFLHPQAKPRPLLHEQDIIFNKFSEPGGGRIIVTGNSELFHR